MSASAISAYLVSKLGYIPLSRNEFVRRGGVSTLTVSIGAVTMVVARNGVVVYRGDIPATTRFLQMLLAHV